MKSDTELQRDVLEELKWDPSVEANHIGVSVKDGVVTLSGHVPSYGEKYGAERAALRVAGMKAVANELDVKLPGSNVRTDEDIAADCVRALRLNVWVPDDNVKCTVANGWVTLEGEVEWEYQREAARNAVSHLRGVKGVTNIITLKPRVEPSELKARIEEALRRQADLDASHVTVEVEGSKVILRGVVRSWTERDEVERAAWSAPGVTTVEDYTAVEPAGVPVGA